MFSKGLTRPVDTAGDRGVGLVSFISLFVNNINGGPRIFNARGEGECRKHENRGAVGGAEGGR